MLNSIKYKLLTKIKRWLKIQSPSLMLIPEYNIKDVKTVEEFETFLKTIEDIYQRSIYYEEEE